MDPPTATGSRNPPSCRQCRARKVRCDRGAPRCGPCRRLGFNCSFSGSPDLPSPDSLPAAELTQAGTKRRRILVACNACRTLKAKCTGGIPCTKCTRRGQSCVVSDDTRDDGQGKSHPTPTSTTSTPNTPGTTSPASRPGAVAASELSVNDDRDRNPIRHYIQVYFARTPTSTCIFLHQPSILADWAQGKLDSALSKALHAAGRCLENGTDDQVAESLMTEARLAVVQRLDGGSLAQLQTLVLVLQYSLHAGDTLQAWNLISLAARLAFALRLNYERPDLSHLARESHRRLFWAIYLLDRLFSGGIPELAVCPAEHIYIRLPCDDWSFERGLASRAEYLGSKNEIGGMDAVAYLIRIYWIREMILRLTKRIRRDNASPVAHASEVSALQSELDGFRASLPTHLQRDPERLPLIAQSSDAHSFLLIHTIWLQCHCDLYRFFISGIRESVSEDVMQNTPLEYVDFCQRECLSKAVQLCDFWSETNDYWPAASTNDHLFRVSVYQVTQILHHLRHLLPQAGQHNIPGMQKSLHQALAMQLPLGRRSLRLRENLEITKDLIEVLGQVRLGQSRSPPDNVHHLPSLGSLLPSALVPSKAMASAPRSLRSSGPSTDAQMTASETQQFPEPRLLNTPSNPGPQIAAAKDYEAISTWDPFDIELNDYYDAEISALTLPMLVNEL